MRLADPAPVAGHLQATSVHLMVVATAIAHRHDEGITGYPFAIRELRMSSMKPVLASRSRTCERVDKLSDRSSIKT